MARSCPLRAVVVGLKPSPSVGRRVTSVAEMAENVELMLGGEESEEDEAQMLEGALVPDEAPMVIPEVPMPQEVTDGVDGYFCKHYKRKCMFVVSSITLQFLAENIAGITLNV